MSATFITYLHTPVGWTKEITRDTFMPLCCVISVLLIFFVNNNNLFLLSWLALSVTDFIIQCDVVKDTSVREINEQDRRKIASGTSILDTKMRLSSPVQDTYTFVNCLVFANCAQQFSSLNVPSVCWLSRYLAASIEPSSVGMWK